MRCIFITGATAGIGKDLVRQYQSIDAKVIFCGRRKSELDALENELNQSMPGSAKGFQIDVSKPGDFDVLTKYLDENHLILDTIIANAGMGVSGRFEKLSNNDYQKQFDVNVWGVLNSIRPFLEMLKTTKGRISIIGSGSSYIATPKTSAYCMSKFAIRAFADCLRAELSATGVSVTMVCPGFISTEIRARDKHGNFVKDFKDPVPSWILMSSKTAAKKIRNAVEKRKSEVWITGHVKIAILMEKIFPPLMRIIKNRMVL